MRVLIFLLLFVNTIYGSCIDDLKVNSNVTSDFYLFVDTKSNLTLQDIKSINSFKPIKANSLTLPLGNANYWLKANLCNSLEKPLTRVLQYNDTMINKVDLFHEGKHLKKGLKRYKTDSYLKSAFHLTIPQESNNSIYIRLRSTSNPINFSLIMFGEEQFINQELYAQKIYTFLYGVLFALIVYNVFIFITLKSLSHLYYVLYIISIGLFISGSSGLDRLFFFKQPYEWYPYLGMPYIAFLSISMILFTQSYLNLKNYRVVKSILNSFIITIVLITLLLLNSSLYHKFLGVSVAIAVLCMFITVLLIFAIWLRGKGDKYFKLYLLGWIPIVVLFLFMFMEVFFNFNLSEYFPYYEVFALILEPLIFAFALSIKVKDINEEKKRAIEELLQTQKEGREILERKVESRTQSLQESLKERDVLLRELNHRVKNNMQIIISMLRMQADECGKEQQEIIAVAENRIRSMLFIHEQLYKQDVHSLLDTKSYLETLISNLLDSFSMDEKQVNQDIESVELTMDQLITCGFIINELLTNAIKHSKDKDGLFIELNLHQVDEKIRLSVEDNQSVSVEFTYEDGLGLTLVKSMVKEQLDGEYISEFKSGWRTIIVFDMKC